MLAVTSFFSIFISIGFLPISCFPLFLLVLRRQAAVFFLKEFGELLG